MSALYVVTLSLSSNQSPILSHVIRIDQSEASCLASDLRLRQCVYSGAVFKETRHTREPIRARRHFETVTTLK